MDNNNKAILKTLLYSDIFDFPLNYNELWRFLISDSFIDKATFDKAIEELLQKNAIVIQEGFYCLPKRELIIDRRKMQKGNITKKLMIAKRVSKYLSFIPTISFVGVSGNVAAGNAQKADDIDFFIVAKKRTIWTTRFLVLVILEIIRLRRRRGQKNVSDTICVNMIVDENSLKLSSDRHDLFTAHEIVQLQPLFVRSGRVDMCLVVNTWVKKFMPNVLDIKILRYKDIKQENKCRKFLLSQLLSPFEYCVKMLQLWLINKHRTTEIISDSLIAFHPTDYRKKTLGEFSKRLENYGAI
ncbi:MAG: hypothetical protein HYT11_04160 [Candidatus Levybacteria bacterium]|nr:hypothetical protein [Candidatus Levybacteria bacterium]